MHSDCSQTNWLLERREVSSMSCDVISCNCSFVIRMENVKLTSRTKFSVLIANFSFLSASSVFVPDKMCKVISYSELLPFSYSQCLDC